MFSFMRWVKEFSLDTGLDDLTALEGYPSLQAVEKLEKLRAEFVAGPTKTVPVRAESAGRTIAPIPTVAISAPAPANRTDAVEDAAPERMRSAG